MPSSGRSHTEPQLRAGKRQAILGAALARFAHYGFRRTAIEDIAQEAGMSRAAVYLHFKNKEQIFRELACQLHEKALTAAQHAIRVDGDVATRIRGVLEAKLATFFAVVHGTAHARELLDENSRICGDLSAEFGRRYLKLLKGAIEAAVAHGELAPQRLGLTAQAAAELIVDCAKGVEVGSAALTPQLYRRRVLQLVEVLVTGLAGRIGRYARRNHAATHQAATQGGLR